jgi:hypothetical protein
MWQTADIASGSSLAGISCASSSLCVAYGGSTVYVSTDPSGGADSWSAVEIDGASTLTGVSCPTASLCVAIDSAGDLITATNPTGGAAAWDRSHVDGASTVAGTGFLSIACASASLCIAGDVGGNVWSSTDPSSGATSWTAAYVDSSIMVCGSEGKYYDPIYCQASIAGVTCASASACLAIDGGGLQFISSDPAAGQSAWSKTGTAPSSRISCPSTSLCLAAGDGSVFSSTDPFANSPPTWGQTAAFDGTPGLSAASCSRAMCAVADASGHILTSAAPVLATSSWSSAYTGVAGVDSLSCPSARFCAAITFAGQVLVSNDPSAPDPTWSMYNIGLNAGAFAISCPSSSLCVAANFQDQVATSINPAAGAGTWSIRTIRAARPAGLACPSVALCVMSINLRDGQLAITTDPTGPARAWRIRRVDTAHTNHSASAAMIGVSCPTTKLCVASDNAGHIVASTDPGNPKASWVQRQVNHGYAIDGVACPEDNLCVAYSALQILTSIDPTGSEPWQETQIAPGGSTSWLGTVACSWAQSCIGVSGTTVWVGTPAPLPPVPRIQSTLRTQLLLRSPKRAVRTLIKSRMLRLHFTALGPVTLRMTWTIGSHRVASGLINVPAAGTTSMILKITATGRKILSSHRSHRIRAVLTYSSAATASPITAARTFLVRR